MRQAASFRDRSRLSGRAWATIMVAMSDRSAILNGPDAFIFSCDAMSTTSPACLIMAVFTWDSSRSPVVMPD